MSDKLFLLFLGLFLIQLDAQPIISQYSPSVFPGDVFRLHGDGFGSDPQVYARSNNNGNSDTMLIIATNVDDVVTAILPSDWIMDVYEIFIKSNGQESNRILLNQPISTMTDMSEVFAGGRFRIFGKNLYYQQSGLTPIVNFIGDNNERIQIELDLQSSDSFVLACYAPEGQNDGKSYRLEVDNGYGRPAIIDPIVTVRNGQDILNTGVGWTVCFQNFTQNVVELSPSNNASFDDIPRIIAAIRGFEYNGGGILKLKAGEYHLFGCNAQLNKNFIMQGEGIDKTIIYYGSDCPDGLPQFYSFGIDAFAFVDMTFRHVSNNIALFHNSHGVSRQVLLRVKMEMGYCGFNKFGGRQNLISEVNITAKSQRDGKFVFGGYSFGCSSELIVRNSNFFYESAAMDAALSNNFIFENNRIIRDQRLQTLFPMNNTNFRGLAVIFANNFVFMNNHMETLNSDPYTSQAITNDGETLLSEAGGPSPGRGAIGNVTLATANSITDSSKNFSNMLFQTGLPLAVAIIRGPGKGQARLVIGAFANGTLVTDHPWSVIPTTESVYSTNVITTNWLVKDNTFIGWAKGAPEMYLGRVANLTVVGNTYINNGGPYVNPSNRYWPSSGTTNCIGGGNTQRFDEESYFAGFSYELYFLNNYMYFTDPNNTAQMGVFGNSAPQYSNFGLIVSGVELRNNSIVRVGKNQEYFGQPDAISIQVCDDGINGAIAQGNRLISTSGLGRSSGTVLACTHTESLLTNITNIGCPGGSADRIVGLNVLPEICTSSKIRWAPDTPTNPPFNTPSLGLSQYLLTYTSILVAFLLVI